MLSYLRTFARGLGAARLVRGRSELEALAALARAPLFGTSNSLSFAHTSCLPPLSTVCHPRNGYTALVMPLIGDRHFSGLVVTGKTFDLRGPLGALAELVLGQSWAKRYRSKEPTATKLEEWYDGALARVYPMTPKECRETEVDYSATKTRLKEWLAEKRKCLEIALNEGRIPRVDALQQVVSSLGHST